MRPSPTGVLLVDKPSGLTSHDVVARVRRALGTRAVGHAGTLDPMASGLLLVLVGEATKLSAHLTGEAKRYQTTVLLGASTDSLDADGAIIETAPITSALRAELSLGEQSPVLRAALEVETTRSEQIPPAVSAIHVDGERAYEKARRGEVVALAPRPVAVQRLSLLGVDTSGPYPAVEIVLTVSKGYYVRSFGRDLGASLGVPAHLSALRRLSSGNFDVADACPLDAPERFASSLLSLEDAARRALPTCELTELGAKKCTWGQKLFGDDFTAPPVEAFAGWFFEGKLVALGVFAEGSGKVARGIVQPRKSPPEDAP